MILLIPERLLTPILMTIEDSYDLQTYKDEFYLKLGSTGFVESAVEKDSESENTQTWTLKYTSDGHLNYVEDPMRTVIVSHIMAMET